MSPAVPVLLTLQAELDLNEIWDYIARDSLEQADRVWPNLKGP